MLVTGLSQFLHSGDLPAAVSAYTGRRFVSPAGRVAVTLLNGSVFRAPKRAKPGKNEYVIRGHAANSTVAHPE